MKERLKAIEKDALSELETVGGDREGLERLRVKYLGRNGILTELFKKIALVAPSEKAEIGMLINSIKVSVTNSIEAALAAAGEKENARIGKIDITFPGHPLKIGKTHPITKTIDEICGIFMSLGFMIVEGPEIETEHYNFETLNIPLEHPSRDAFDTFYLNSKDGKHLLRSHTSPVQTRFMEKTKPPFSIIVPGKVYRPDATDASHSFMFHQIEGLAVADDIKFSDLKGALSVFAKRVFGSDAKTRFRPSFFPFTEPSAEVDVSCMICGANSQDCSVCGGKGWLEILGAGMVNPKVFSNVGYNPEKVTGFAFGMGVERIAMLKYGISDIRMFFENDVRFLRQF